MEFVEAEEPARDGHGGADDSVAAGTSPLRVRARGGSGTAVARRYASPAPGGPQGNC
jgi:hypothetical protein